MLVKRIHVVLVGLGLGLAACGDPAAEHDSESMAAGAAAMRMNDPGDGDPGDTGGVPATPGSPEYCASFTSSGCDLLYCTVTAATIGTAPECLPVCANVPCDPATR